MNVSETYGINGYSGVRNYPYITEPRLQGASPAKQPPGSRVLEKTPARDTFSPQSKPFEPSVNGKALSNVQDALLVNFLPEVFIAKYANKEFLEKAVTNNPNIAELLKQEGLEVKIEPENVTSIAKSHLIPAMMYAREVLKQSGINYSQNDLQNLLQAALLHDIGKALIPSEILNKKGSLTEKEREIINLHNDLGYEILKNAALDTAVLEMVKNHHNYNGQGKTSELIQILKIADIYSALKEERPYKKVLNDEEAFKILEEDAQNGEFAPQLINSLKNSLNNKLAA